MKLALALGTLTLSSLLVACGGSDEDPTPPPTSTLESSSELPVLDITKHDQGFDAPATVSGGLTRIRVHNAGTQDHSVNFGRFADGATLEQFDAAVRLAATDFPASAAEVGRLTDGVGGTGSVAPGGTAEVVLDLTPGRYVMVRFRFGMPDTAEFEVTSPPTTQVAPPESAFTVSMSEFAYKGFPETLDAGTTTMEVVNAGDQIHVMEVRRFNEEGIAAEQLRQHLAGTPLPVAPSYTASGGMGELLPGDSGWAIVDLEPGVYTLICYVFDQGDSATGKLHADLGMHHVFTVE
jgi:hypothetical protein